MADKDVKQPTIGEQDPVIGGPAGAIPVDQLITAPTGAPYVGPDAGPETREAREMREARGDPEPRPLWGKGAQGMANKPLGFVPEKTGAAAHETKPASPTARR
jgi:hypothetical protein